MKNPAAQEPKHVHSENRKIGAAVLSIVVNLALLGIKITVAFVTGSIGLLAETAHSLFDLVASVLAYLGVKKAGEPEDHSHHFGHEKFENLSSMLQAMLITATAMLILFGAYEKALNPKAIELPELGIVVMLISIIASYLTSKYLGETAEKEHSSALAADSAHFTTDVIGSIAVLVGLVMVKIGYQIGDALAAGVVGIIMLAISLELMLHSFVVFMDFSPDRETMRKIRDVLVKEKRITRFHKLRARFAGKRILVDVHIHVPHAMSISYAHTIAHKIENEIILVLPQVKEVNVHIEPD